MPKLDDDTLLVYIGVACALLFAGAVTFIVIAQTVAPLFGLQAGNPSDAAIGTMVAAVVTLTTAAGVKVVKRFKSNGTNGGASPPDEGAT